MHEWGKRKSIQPAVSVGCVFQNISQELREKFNYPTTSVGYIIEHILHMSGFRIGDAVVSPKHSNFIVNEGNATAQQYLEIIQEIQARTKQKLKLDLKTEIFLMGEF